MTPDFNGDGRFDGYDMEYLGGSGSSGGSGSCGGSCLKGCGWTFCLLVILCFFFDACSRIMS